MGLNTYNTLNTYNILKNQLYITHFYEAQLSPVKKCLQDLPFYTTDEDNTPQTCLLQEQATPFCPLDPLLSTCSALTQYNLNTQD